MEQSQQPFEKVNHPKHYEGKIECIDYLEDQFADRPHEWSAVKHITRAGRKPGEDELDDLRKAQFYLTRKIQMVQKHRAQEALDVQTKAKQEVAAKEKQELADQADRDARKKSRAKAKIKPKTKKKTKKRRR